MNKCNPGRVVPLALQLDKTRAEVCSAQVCNPCHTLPLLFKPPKTQPQATLVQQQQQLQCRHCPDLMIHYEVYYPLKDWLGCYQQPLRAPQAHSVCSVELCAVLVCRDRQLLSRLSRQSKCMHKCTGYRVDHDLHTTQDTQPSSISDDLQASGRRNRVLRLKDSG